MWYLPYQSVGGVGMTKVEGSYLFSTKGDKGVNVFVNVH